MRRRGAPALAMLLAGWLAAAPAWPQAQSNGEPRSDLVSLDFHDAELPFVIDTIAQMTKENFIYDDKVRGRVTIVSPTPVTVEQAYAVFESVLRVKGFTPVRTPGGAIKIIPIRDAPSDSIQTIPEYRMPPDRDRFVTRLIPLRYIEAGAIANTLKPLVSKEAAMVAYEPTNTIILTETSSNIRRILGILEAIDIETHREDLAIIKLDHADAATLAQQISEIFGAEVAATAATPPRRGRRRGQAQATSTGRAGRGRVRIITDERTNSLIVLAARAELDDVRRLVGLLDVPVIGGGRVHVYYLKHADAEELAQTLNALITGQTRGPARGATPGGRGAAGQPQQLRAVVTELAEGVSLTADPGTNALVIQASKEGFETLVGVIQQLDVERPQVLVEALIMEVDVSHNRELGFDGIYRLITGDSDLLLQSVTDSQLAGIAGAAAGGPIGSIGASFLASYLRDKIGFDSDGEPLGEGTLISTILRASGADAGINIISAPHILTSDNEEAEIRIGDNIPIITSRVQQPTGATQLSTSVNVERQDIGVTLRVTPQITEGDTVRLEIFQELSAINEGIQQDVGNPNEVGVPLSNRRIENTVVVSDGETVVIGGLISDDYADVVTKVPWLGDIPVLGWLFKTTDRRLRKQNLIVFLTPHIIRSSEDLEKQTIRKREEFREHGGEGMELTEEDHAEQLTKMAEARAAGVAYDPGSWDNPTRRRLLEHEARYPLERMRQIEMKQEEERQLESARAEKAKTAPRYVVLAAVLGDEAVAIEKLTQLLDAGYDGTLVSGQVGDSVIYEIRLGPYQSLDEAQQASETVQRSHGLTPAIVLEPPKEP